MMVKKLRYPKFLESVPCRIVIYSEGLNEDTGAAECAVDWGGKCIWSEIRRQVIKDDRNDVRLRGKVYVEGDIAPGVSGACGGYVTVYPGMQKECRMMIYQIERPRNPDGSVNHSCMLVV